MTLRQPNLERMLQLGLSGMVEALEEQHDIADIGQLDFDDRLAMLLEREVSHRDQKSYLGYLRQAQLRVRADIQEEEPERPDTVLALTAEEQRLLFDRIAMLDRCSRGLHDTIPGIGMSMFGALAVLCRIHGGEDGNEPKAADHLADGADDFLPGHGLGTGAQESRCRRHVDVAIRGLASAEHGTGR